MGKIQVFKITSDIFFFSIHFILVKDVLQLYLQYHKNVREEHTMNGKPVQHNDPWTHIKQISQMA